MATKPKLKSMQTTGSLPSFLERAQTSSTVSSEVSVPLTTSTSFITPTGLEKCMPSTLSGLLVALAISVMFS